MTNPNVMTEGSGRMSVQDEDDRLMVHLVWDGARENENRFLIGKKDAVALAQKLLKAAGVEPDPPVWCDCCHPIEAGFDYICAGCGEAFRR